MIEGKWTMIPGLHFEKNLAALKKIHPSQGEAIATLSPKVEYRLYPVTPLGDGFFNVTIPLPAEHSVSLFLTPDPQNELRQWLTNPLRGAAQTHAVILLGFGMGYEASRLLEALPAHGILILVEPDPIQFFTAFHHADLTALLGNPRVHLYVGQTAEQAVDRIGRDLDWSRFFTLPCQLWTIPLLERVRPGFSQEFRKAWHAIRQQELTHRQMRIERGKQEIIHTIANAEAAIRYPGIDSLFHHFSGIPALLAAPGSTLEKNCHNLRHLQNRLLIACLNTAYPVLRRHGIRPHLVFAMEHQEGDIFLLQNDTPSPITYLVADPRVHPDVIRHFHPRVFLASWRSTSETLGQPVPFDQLAGVPANGNPIFQWLQSIAGSKGDVYSPGGAAAVSFHMLARMGCQPIILAGHDYAHLHNPAHDTGMVAINRLSPRELVDIPTDTSPECQNVSPNGLRSLCRQWLEHEINRFNVPVYNTSAASLIVGAITSRLESIFAELPNRVFDLPPQMESLHSLYVPQLDTIDLAREFARAIRRLEALAEAAQAGLESLPPDMDFSRNVGEEPIVLERLEKTVADCATEHAEALELLTELLRLVHLEMEDCRWRSLLHTSEEALRSDQLHQQVRTLDAYIGQARLLISLMEEQIARWEAQ